jgi:hypothetical protein
MYCISTQFKNSKMLFGEQQKTTAKNNSKKQQQKTTAKNNSKKKMSASND